MKQAVTPRILSHISNMISSGRPVWGLLWANEYLRHEPEIRSAYVRKARSFIKVNGCVALCDEAIQSIYNGSTLTELSHTFQQLIKQAPELVQKRKQTVIQMKPWKTLRESSLRRTSTAAHAR